MSRIDTKFAPKAIGPYSQAIRLNSEEIEAFLSLSGQIAIDPETNQFIDGDAEAQTKQVMKNLDAVLKAGGSSFQFVYKTRIYLADMSDFPKVNEVYASYFKNNAFFPARATVAAKELPKSAKVEIEVEAVVRRKFLSGL